MEVPMLRKPYTLTLTPDDVSAIAWAGNRYGWSESLLGLGIREGENQLAEHEAWSLRDACESDADGGHSMFPLLDSRSELAGKLSRFLDSIV